MSAGVLKNLELNVAIKIDRQQILDALTRYAGNQTRAARYLGVSRRTLISRLDLFGITRPRKDPLQQDTQTAEVHMLRKSAAAEESGVVSLPARHLEAVVGAAV
jgi:hypothetical protein